MRAISPSLLPSGIPVTYHWKIVVPQPEAPQALPEKWKPRGILNQFEYGMPKIRQTLPQQISEENYNNGYFRGLPRNTKQHLYSYESITTRTRRLTNSQANMPYARLTT